jgi:hypothetical protein
MKWMVESERMLTCLAGHDWWAHHPRLLREDVRQRAEQYATGENKSVYQQHVLRAAADEAERTNNAIWERRQTSRQNEDGAA